MNLGLLHNGNTFSIPRRNTLLIGQKRTGKTHTLVRLCLDDIYNGESVVFIDPVGDAIDLILNRIPAERREDVILIEPARTPFALNLFNTTHEPSLLARAMVDVIKGIAKYDALATPRMDDFIRTGTHTLLQVPEPSLVALYYFLTSKPYRDSSLGHIHDPVLLAIWDDFNAMSDKDRRQFVESTANKLRAFVLDATVRNCIDQRHNHVVLKDKIVLLSLREGTIGLDNATFFGLLVLAQVYMDGVGGIPTTLYIDGAPRFSSSLLSNILTVPSITTMLSATDLDPSLLRVEQIVAMRTSVADSERLSPEFGLPTNLDDELSKLVPYRAYVYADGTTTRVELPELDHPLTRSVKAITNRCARDYSARQSVLDQRQQRFFGT